ncbi:MAG: ATP-dependent protease [Desulfuromonas sp.]|nr:MAG: ATP-dependent protease [Desulfuromonas sp.]
MFGAGKSLDVGELSWRCDPAQFEFSSTAELPPLEGTIGQDRALTAIEFGLGMAHDGFNIFILGEPGSGRASTIKKLLKGRAAQEPVPDDWCYVHDFDQPDKPIAFGLPAGTGAKLRDDVEELVTQLAEEVPKLFESKEYEQQKNKINSDYQERNKQYFQELEDEASRQGFMLQRTVSGLVLVPVHEDHALSQQEYDDLSDELREEIDRKGNQLHEKLNDVMRQVRESEKEMRKAIDEMEQEMLHYTLGHHFEELEEKYEAHEQALRHFEGCKKDIVGRIDELRPGNQQVSIGNLRIGGQQEVSFERYRINLFLDNNSAQGAPVVYESNPTYFNLFGRVEHVIQMGNASTNFTMIKPGALHRASGGYLILDCREVLINMFTYEALKRCIRHGEIRIEDITEQFRFFATVTMKPEPIPLDCKIILIGPPQLYYLLYRHDPDFRKFFKVKADFDRQMHNTWENIQQYALFIASKCTEEGLRHFDPGGVSRVVEFSARLIEDQRRLSSQFLAIADLIREAGYYAQRHNRELVSAQDVELAMEARIYRSNKVEERIQELIDEETLLVTTSGEMAGQVNGLTVYQLGDFSFGRPARVTVRTFLGKAGLINIEREAKLSGAIHDKGLLILTGFFGSRFAQQYPLSFAASICFEQSYGGVDGDSASTTELYALLSSLSGIAIRQGVAVTGSVNQFGQVQAIGGVNEKVEGYYAVCKAQGLTGEQGVVIPQSNVKNLMLKSEVREAVEKGEFHIWAVEHVDQGIELLTGLPAGERQEDGEWTEGSINALVDKRLREMAESARKFASKGNGNSKGEK